MPLDRAALEAGAARSGAEVRLFDQLCRGERDAYVAAVGEGRPVTVACTQERALFAQEADSVGAAEPVCVNVREHAGWSDEAASAGPKMAALLAAAALPLPPTQAVTLRSEGVCLVLGRDACAQDAALRLADVLDLTVLLTGQEEVTPLRDAPFPVLRGRARTASGWLGAFAVTVDGFAAAAPSSRGAYRWGPARDGAVSRCDVLLDLSGGPALFPLAEARSGYLRADPDDAAAVERAIAAAAQLVGTFDKPRFVAYDAGLCAHGRNRRTGCSRCLDLCPTGAITAETDGRGAPDSVAVSAEICAGCGACAAVCPTGAITYALPAPDRTLSVLREALRTFAAAGGRDPVVLLMDAAHGVPLVDALARHGPGLPARVLPITLNAVGQADLALLAGALAWGAAGVRALLPGRRGHGADGLLRNLEYGSAALVGLGLEGTPPRLAAIETDDPFALADALAATLKLRTGWTAAEFLPLDAPREVALQAFRALGPNAVVPLPALAPYGRARVEVAGCTLCLACTSVCPTGAFGADPDSPALRFTESACVQCGLCVNTCPERVIALEPRLDLSPAALEAVVVKAEAPVPCARCGTPFGTRSTLDRVRAQLAGKHWMFADPARLKLLELCESCRVFAATDGGIDPYAGAPRPTVKTTEDYVAEAAKARDE